MDPFEFVRRSYDQLLDTNEGYLSLALREVGLIQSEWRQWEIALRAVRFERPRLDEQECVLRGLSLVVPLKLAAQQLLFTDEEPRAIVDVREQEMYSSELPIPTCGGTLVIDGEHRVVRSELGVCEGFAPFERGWRYGNAWGDCIEFVPVRDGVELTYRLADDSVSARWTHEPLVTESKGKKSALREPSLPEKLVLRSSADIQDFLSKYPLPTGRRAVIAPATLFAGAADQPWSAEDLERVLDWVRTDAADALRRAHGTPLRVLGPGLIIARWVRRGLFLTAMDALDRGDTMSFGPRAKPKRKRDFTWLPHDAWNARPLAALLRARIESEATAPRAPIASPVAVATLHRSLRVASNVRVPSGWLSATVKKVTIAELPMCELDRAGEILAPDRFTARTIRGALGLSATDREVDPLPIAAPDALPADAALSAACARETLATRRFDEATSVLARTDDALAVRDSRGARWIARSPDSAQRRRLAREELVASVRDYDAGARYGDSLTSRDGALALGKLVRIGFDSRVRPGAAWVSTARLGDALDAMRAERVESTLRDTRAGREAWRDADTVDSLADVGTTVLEGAALATVLVPTDDASLSPEERLLRAIDGAPMGAATERAVRWTGPAATVVARTVFARRGVDELVPVVRAREAVLRSLQARMDASIAVQDEPARAALLEQVNEAQYAASRGCDLPPGVIAVATWLLAWRAPVAVESALALRNDTRITVERVSDERYFEGAAEVDLLVHPSMRDAITAAQERSLEFVGATPGDAPPACYVLREP